MWAVFDCGINGALEETVAVVLAPLEDFDLRELHLLHPSAPGLGKRPSLLFRPAPAMPKPEGEEYAG